LDHKLNNFEPRDNNPKRN
jgi:hypothetical protein